MWGDKEIYLNLEVNYPNGFSVDVEGKSTEWYSPEKNRVNVVSKEEYVKVWIGRKDKKSEKVKDY